MVILKVLIKLISLEDQKTIFESHLIQNLLVLFRDVLKRVLVGHIHEFKGVILEVLRDLHGF